MTAPALGSTTPSISAEDRELLEALRRGDEAAFVRLVETLHGSMLRLAIVHVGDRAVAEEVVQDAWLGVLGQLDRFEGRSSLKTWLFRIVANTAKTRGVREARSAPFSSFADDEAAVSPDRFLGAGDRFPGHWAVPPASWAGVPEERLLAAETLEVIGRAIERLPPVQRAVLTLRDLEGLSADEVCNALDLTETNGRVLLHRARSKVRAALEEYLR